MKEKNVKKTKLFILIEFPAVRRFTEMLTRELYILKHIERKKVPITSSVLVMFVHFVSISCIPVHKGHPAVEATFGLLQFEVNGLVVGIDRRLADGFVVARRTLESFHSSAAVPEKNVKLIL